MNVDWQHGDETERKHALVSKFRDAMKERHAQMLLNEAIQVRAIYL
jgi:hypothetical protein